MNDELRSQMIHMTSDQIELFTLNTVQTTGKVVELHDGDTCKMILFLNGRLEKYNCRLLGIDAPEIKPLLSKPNREQEIARAHECRNRLMSLVTSCECPSNNMLKAAEQKLLLNANTKLIHVQCHEFDKYGRLLVTLFPSEDGVGRSVNQTLVDETLAHAYDGGKKEVW